MAKCENQKLKILYILDMLARYSDLENGLTMQEILSRLEGLGIKAERKSVYSDIALLRDVYGADIDVRKSGKSTEYYMGSREFELSELKLLVDAVCASKFITNKKSAGLVKKLESLASVYQAKGLRSQVYVADRIKTMNESIYINVDAVNEAILHGKKIAFRYFEWTPKGEKRLRRDGDYYVVSPCALCWDDENYYLVAGENGIVKHYRVDKMQSISVLDEKREIPEEFNAENYRGSVFGMFGGREENVTLYCKNSICGAVIDRFGRDIMMMQDGDGFRITRKIRISPQFFGWLAGFGSDIQIVSPEGVKEEYKNHVKSILEQY